MERLTSLFRDPRVAGGATTMAATLALATVVGVGWWLAGTDNDRPGEVGAGPTAPVSASADGLGTATPGGQTTTENPASGTGGAGGRPEPSGTGERPGASEPAGPTIETFQVVEQPRCPGGTTANPIEGQPVTLAWRVTGVDEVTISIDGPGVYATYPAEASDTYSFGCGGDEGDIQRHTYLLTAVAGESTVTRTLEVTAIVQQRTQV